MINKTITKEVFLKKETTKLVIISINNDVMELSINKETNIDNVVIKNDLKEVHIRR